MEKKMIIEFTMKTPDTVDNILNEHFPIGSEDWTEDDENAFYNLKEKLEKYFLYGECLRITFDTKTEKFTVKRVR
jgi:hypothetical protein